jgi:hypothetical protein
MAAVVYGTLFHLKFIFPRHKCQCSQLSDAFDADTTSCGAFASS